MPDDVPVFIDPMECPWRSPREIFARFGYSPPAPNEVSDQQLPGRLWELLYTAAGRRFFFYGTDHLDDRGLYQLLWEQWLDEPTADIPAEAETNTTAIISEFNALGMTHDEIWLRYYANEEDRALCHSADSTLILPPHEEPPHDRDRFLPMPPVPLQAHSDWLPGDDASSEEDESDLLGLSQVDQEIGAAKESPASLTAEREPTANVFQLLPPAEITDEMLAPILWELLHNLALRSFYVLHTDHLTDLQLYTELWTCGLPKGVPITGRNPRGGWFHDVLGSWGAEEMQIWLRYYATDEERAKHAKEWPDDIIPPKEIPITNRDWRLPKGPF